MIARAFDGKIYTLEEFLNFVESDISNTRYELIDGAIYAMASPTVTHQRLVKFIYHTFSLYFRDKKCEVFFAPLDVYLFAKLPLFTVNNKKECKNVYQPDIFIVCDKEKIKKHGIEGAPDLVVEVVSPSTSYIDYVFKLNNYMKYGVKEYWILDYAKNRITIYENTDEEFEVNIFNFESVIYSNVFENLCIDFSQFKDD